MEKFFNNEIVNYLRSKNRNKNNLQDMLYQDGDKFIWRQPGPEKEVDVSAKVKSSYSFNDDPIIALLPESNKVASESTVTEDSSTIHPNSSSSITKVNTCSSKNTKRSELIKLVPKSFGKHEEVTRIRSLLGPFPDEPFMAALDNLLYYLNGICRGSDGRESLISKKPSSDSDSVGC